VFPEFFERRAFGQPVDLSDPEIVRAMATPLAHFVTVKTFSTVLSAAAIVRRRFGRLVGLLAERAEKCSPIPSSISPTE